jgi:predicted acyltransferase
MMRRGQVEVEALPDIIERLAQREIRLGTESDLRSVRDRRGDGMTSIRTCRGPSGRAAERTVMEAQARAPEAAGSPAAREPRTDVAAAAAPPRPPRLWALDAARGLAIVVMLVVMNPGPASELPGQLHHPDWHGLTFADLFFPLFLCAAGVAMTFSSRGLNGRHVLYRAAVLLALGIALASLKHETFGVTGVLQHIAGACLVAFLVLRLPRRSQLPVTAGMVILYWVAFTVWAPGDDPWAATGTLAHEVDGFILGGFTTEGTLQTFISGVNVLGGAFVGRLIHDVSDRERLVKLLVARAAGLIGLGLLLSLVVPLNKRLWSPPFTVLTVGTSLAWLAIGIWLIDLRGARRATAPLVHLGANPIAIYVGFFTSLSVLRKHGGSLVPDIAPGGSVVAGAFLYAGAWTALWWIAAYALYRRRIFIKI